MSEEQLKAFLEKVQGDTSLQEKLKAATDANAVIAIANEAGYMISADYISKAQSEISEITEEDLESISGGGNWTAKGKGGTIEPLVHGSVLCGDPEKFLAWVRTGQDQS